MIRSGPQPLDSFVNAGYGEIAELETNYRTTHNAFVMAPILSACSATSALKMSLDSLSNDQFAFAQIFQPVTKLRRMFKFHLFCRMTHIGLELLDRFLKFLGRILLNRV